MGRPLQMTYEIGRYLLARRRWPERGQLFPIVLMLEPLEACNLQCVGCGRVREYADHMGELMSVERALAVAAEADAPVVSVSGGEPLLHPEIADMVSGLVDQRRWVFLCTNGLLLRKALPRLAPHRRLCFVVHLDGTAAVHDRVTGRPGTYQEAIAAIREAVSRGHRVCTNTTVFHGTDVEDTQALFRTLRELGVEGLMLSPGYAYQSVLERELFLQREESVQVFRRLLDGGGRFPFYDNPLFLDFLRGERTYPCSAWAVPTYTVLGWRKPCYLIADQHVQDLGELLDPGLWSRHGPGNDPRCAGCMLHSGFEPASVLDAVNHPWRLLPRRKAAGPRASTWGRAG
ncbi:MAG: adenosyl-hopene transferase HpnH [Candidatus Bipolaricaulaceae bacterium]